MLELLVVMGILLLVGGFIFLIVNSTRKSAAGVDCIANLRQIGQAFQQYAANNNDKLPDPFLNQVSWEASLKPLLSGDAAFRCPSDSEVGPTVGSSYDWRDTGNPKTTLAGRAMTDCNRGNAVLALDALPGWHEAKCINVVRLDGTASLITDRECFDDLANPIR
jgi:type II secretory pathway pseudopilin PulG